ncbi:MAG TPA: aminotransferase class V-fold PLP-dependent enzyme [Bryobacteraceae bacterium]|nr:aminotransferase class V-fold PLP-dependent enzyme [Bryobacteraceae bacterium]
MHRRDALRASGVAALFGLPFDIKAGPTPPLPPEELHEQNPDTYWERIREEQFLLPRWRVYFNNGSLGVTPRPVVDAVVDYVTRGAELNAGGYPRWGYELLDQQRTELAGYVGCNKDNLALMHNATEAMSTIAAGLDLQAGDEVLITNQEHVSGRSGWLQKQARHGITVREVKIPLPPKSPEQLADLLVSAIGPRTRVISFSGITSPTGLILPMRDICRAARAKGVITVVDGAQVHGQIALKISDLDCDFFAGSPHKWMFAPPGSGMLYIRDEWLDRLWPLTVTGSWDNRSLKAARFMMMGTNNRAIVEGMVAGLRFANAIGPDRIYARIHQLARRVVERASALPYIEMVTPPDDRMYAALVSIKFKKDPSKIWPLCGKKKIWISGGERVRLSTHIHTRPADIDLFFDTVRQVLG